MTTSDQMVACGEHGQTPPAFVCKHTFASGKDGVPRGLIWTRDDDGHINAFCDECDAYLDDHGGEWNDTTEAFAGIHMLCEHCFGRIAALNGIEDLN